MEHFLELTAHKHGRIASPAVSIPSLWAPASAPVPCVRRCIPAPGWQLLRASSCCSSPQLRRDFSASLYTVPQMLGCQSPEDKGNSISTIPFCPCCFRLLKAGSSNYLSLLFVRSFVLSEPTVNHQQSYPKIY